MHDEPNTGQGLREKAGRSEKLVALLLAGLIAAWLVAYAVFAAQAWLGKA